MTPIRTIIAIGFSYAMFIGSTTPTRAFTPPEDIDRVIAQAPIELEYRLSKVSWTSPLYETVADIKPFYRGEVTIDVEASPTPPCGKGYSCFESAELTRLRIETNVDGKTTIFNVPASIAAQIAYPKLFKIALYSSIDGNTGKISEVFVRVPFGTKEQIHACFERYENDPEWSDRIDRMIGLDMAANLDVSLAFDGTYEVLIGQPGKCKDIYEGYRSIPQTGSISDLVEPEARNK